MDPIGAPSFDATSIGAIIGKDKRRRQLSPAALAIVKRDVRSAYSPVVIAGAVRLIDLASVALIGLGLFLAFFNEDIEGSWRYLVGAAAAAAATVFMFQVVGLYRLHYLRTRSPQTVRIAICWGFVFATVFGGVHVARMTDVSLQIWFAAFVFVGLLVLNCERLALRVLLSKWAKEGRLDRRTVIVGADKNGEQLIRALKAQEGSNIDILGVFDDRGDDRAMDICAGVPKLGKVDDILEFAQRTRVDLVLFALPISAEKRILQMLKKLWVLPVDIHLSAHTNELHFRPRYYSNLGQLPTLPMFETPITDWDMVTKWVFDRVFGALLLLVAAPVMAIVAVAIKLDSRGPVFFRQKRFGFNNERIDVLKFRSLHHHWADPMASKVVTKNDPRVTRVGRFIRKASLDELPQLLNVVFEGNLSLVGPRPHAVQGKLEDRLFDEAVDGYFARHRVKPGITGWAQINGWRGEIDTQTKIQKRVEFDLHYIENWSVLFDLYILCCTPLALLETEHAY
ncbi:MAG: undecaprenyl-phosphate glucose phosphotransferase [Acidobacteria bacterium]|nr:MAG: undecaprenyl-phosphate glucose phosphotransferase [Acidobacteriota bacterium]